MTELTTKTTLDKPQNKPTVKTETPNAFWTSVLKLGGAWVSSDKKGRKANSIADNPDSSQLVKLSRRIAISSNVNNFELAMLIATQGNATYPTYRNLLSLIGHIKPNQEIELLKAILNGKNATDELLYDLEQLPRFSHPDVQQEVDNVRKQKKRVSQLKQSISKINPLDPRKKGNMLSLSRTPNRQISQSSSLSLRI